MLPKPRFSKTTFNHSAGSSKFVRPHCKQFRILSPWHGRQHHDSDEQPQEHECMVWQAGWCVVRCKHSDPKVRAPKGGCFDQVFFFFKAWWTFRIFFIFLLGGGQGGVRSSGRGGGDFWLKIPGAGGSPPAGGGARGEGRGGCLRGFCGGGGV